MSLINFFLHKLGRFEQWFDLNLGWFFTNGMKEQHQADPSVRA